ncbi:hypothetical protein MLD38_040123 [Melastoma candidum]|uniref:Uncharacterized protein n=1 Tax=Melastoma candidum TaxID=119954 RepID=A0ACB9L528_9MYRT|nr:hypothetical protein MLD38_040123 [Melastoma candidum]
MEAGCHCHRPSPVDDAAGASDFFSVLTNIVRGNTCWKKAFSDPSIAVCLKPHHVEGVIFRLLDDPRLALRFFNFLGLHRGFSHSMPSFCLLVFGPISSGRLLPCWKPYWFITPAPGRHLAYVQSGRAVNGAIFLELMAQRGLFPEVRTLSALLNGSDRCRKFKLVVHLLECIVWSGVQPDVYVFSVVVRSLCEMRDFVKAKEAISSMEQSGCASSVVPYNVLINGLCKNLRFRDAVDLEEAELLSSELKRRGLPFNSVTYSVFINHFYKKEDSDKALQYLYEMDSRVIKGTVSGYNTVINWHCKLLDSSKAESFLNEMADSGITPTGVRYFISVDGYCKLDRAFSLLNDMVKRGLIPDTYTYCSLISGLCLTGKVAEAKGFVDNLHRQGITLNEMCYSELLHGYCRAGRLEDAIRTARDMVERGVNVDLVCYGILINGNLHEHDMCSVFSLLEEMREQRLKPDHVMKLDEAVSICDELTGEGCRPNVVTYTALINGLYSLAYGFITYDCCPWELGHYRMALELQDDMMRRGIMPTKVKYDNLSQKIC